MKIKKGDIYGFIGRNGAGKTTLLRMLGALMQPTCGSVAIEDENGNVVDIELTRPEENDFEAYMEERLEEGITFDEDH